jgi:hypothetical protein
MKSQSTEMSEEIPFKYIYEVYREDPMYGQFGELVGRFGNMTIAKKSITMSFDSHGSVTWSKQSDPEDILMAQCGDIKLQIVPTQCYLKPFRLIRLK